MGKRSSRIQRFQDDSRNMFQSLEDLSVHVTYCCSKLVAVDDVSGCRRYHDDDR